MLMQSTWKKCNPIANGWIKKQLLRGAIGVMLAGAILMPAGALAAAPTSGFAVVNTDNVHLRKSPSTKGDSMGLMSKGDIVRVLWEEGEFRRVSFGKTEAYIHQDLLDAKTGSDTATGGTHKYTGGAPKLGDEGEIVKRIQQLLIKKGYLFSEATGVFGQMTDQAVRDFQRQNDLNVDGIVGSDTMKLLEAYIDTDAEEIKGSVDVVIKMGDENDEVANIQKALRNKGYYEGSIDGKFGNATLAAVKDFQSVNKLTSDGACGKKTLTALYGDGKSKPVQTVSTTATKAKAEQSKAKATASVQSTDGKIITKDWFESDIQSIFPRGASATVIDTRTGMSFNVHRKGGTNHADVEPLTADDTAIMKQIRGSWSWDRRPLVIIIDGQMIAASWNGMPHGQEDIGDNNFAGHFCIHFTNSRTHSSNKVDKLHQNAIQEALGYGQ